MISMLSDEGAAGGDGTSRLSKWHLGPSSSSRPQPPALIPQHIFYCAGRFLRLLSVYLVHRFLLSSNASVALFVYFCLLGSSLLFFLLQRPWRGKRLSNNQWLISILNGSVYALSILLFGYALKTCGPIRTILAEYAGAIVSAFSTLLFGRRGHRVGKIYGIVTMVAAFFLLARGWALGPTIHLNADAAGAAPTEKETVGAPGMLLAAAAGILSAFRRLVARLGKSQQKKRLHAVTAVSSTLFLLPLAILQMSSGSQAFPSKYSGSTAQVYGAFMFFGIVLAFYIDTFAEDKLRIGPSSLKHLAVTAASVSLLELAFSMPFSLLGFLLLTSLLGTGIFWSTSVDRVRPSGQLQNPALHATLRDHQRLSANNMLRAPSS